MKFFLIISVSSSTLFLTSSEIVLDISIFFGCIPISNMLASVKDFRYLIINDRGIACVDML